MKTAFLQAIGAAGLLLASSAAGQAASYNFDFSDHFASPASTYAAAGDAGIWNVTGEFSAAGAGFTNVTGLIGAVGVAITATNTAGWISNCAADDFSALACDNFYTLNGSWTLDVTGLLDGAYDVHLYAPSNGAVALGDGNANGVSFASIDGGATLAANVSYLTLADVLVSGGALTVTATSVGTGFSYAGLAGMQLVGTVADVPLPAGGLLLLSGLIAVGAARRRRA